MPITKKKLPPRKKPVVKEVPVIESKPIKDPPPDTFPVEPESHRGQCMHSKKVFVPGKAGYNCRDCGFFVSIASVRWQNTEPVKEHVAVFHEVKVRPTPQIDNLKIIEVPRSAFHKVDGSILSILGENDKERLEILKDYLSKYELKSFSVLVDKYVFLFVK